MRTILLICGLVTAAWASDPSESDAERRCLDAQRTTRLAAEMAAAWIDVTVAEPGPVNATSGQTPLAAAQAARDAKALEVARTSERFRAAETRRAALDAEIAHIAVQGSGITDPELLRLAELRLERREVDHQIGKALQAVWTRTAVLPLYEKADALYKKTAKDKAVAAAAKATKEARAATVAALLAKGRGGQLAADRSAAELVLAEAKALLQAEREPFLAGRSFEVAFTVRPDTGKERPGKATLWVPADDGPLRGFLAGHPPMLGTSVLADPHVRMACHELRMATIAFELDGLFTYTGNSPVLFQDALVALGAKAGIPDLPTLPFIGIGHSTSGIWARNLAYWAPERAIGVLHIKSGNLHQHRPDPARTLIGVPFLAINGEYEEFGPEGGMKGGIQPAYGAQTQWVLIREQLLRWRRSDPAYLCALVVHPGSGHGSWADGLGRISAQFIRDSCARRLPAQLGPLLVVRPEDGWLIDADLTTPSHPPAPWSRFAGDRRAALWLPGQGVAESIAAWHSGRLLLDDPTVATPVPASWPPGIIR